MKRYVALLLTFVLVIAATTIGFAVACTHPRKIAVGPLEEAYSYVAAGHRISYYQNYICADCGEEFKVLDSTTVVPHTGYSECLADLGHSGSTHRWKMGYTCCSYTYTVSDPCSGPPCPSFRD